MDSTQDTDAQLATGGGGPLLDAYLTRRADLIRYFAARLRSAEAAEDLIQDLYLRVSALPPGETIDNPSAYLYRLCTNLMLDRMRREQRNNARDTAWYESRRVGAVGQEVADEASPEQAAAARERLARTVAAIKALPPRTRRAFEMHKLEGLSQEETAQALGVSRKTVEKQVSAALRRIVSKLGDADV